MISPETRMMGLPYGEGIMIVGRTTWTQSTSVTDGRTDMRTDRITITDTVQRIASHGKNRLIFGNVKTYKNFVPFFWLPCIPISSLLYTLLQYIGLKFGDIFVLSCPMFGVSVAALVW